MINKENRIKKQELINLFHQKIKIEGINLKQKDCNLVFDTIFTVIKEVLKNDYNKVGISGFGIFSKKYKKSRIIKVPKNNPIMIKGTKISELNDSQLKEIVIPAKNILVFKASKNVQY